MTAQTIQSDKAILVNWINELKDVSLLKEMKKFYIKSEKLSKEDELLISELKEAVENLKLVQEGKMIARPARDLIDEL